MPRQFILASLIAVLIAFAGYTSQSRMTPEAINTGPPSSVATLTKQDGRYLFNIVLHTPEEIAGMLARAEQLAAAAPAGNPRAGIALVLHGPEIDIFARRNYGKFQPLVDLAARLDAANIIDVKMCVTEMQLRDIGKEDIPAFIDLVPFGPDEEERLRRRRGYVYL